MEYQSILRKKSSNIGLNEDAQKRSRAPVSPAIMIRKMKIKIKLTILVLIISFGANHIYASPKVTQAASVYFTNNDVIALAVEEFSKPPLLHFVTTDKKIIQTIKFNSDIVPIDEFSFVNCFLKFKIFEIKDFPSPFLIALAVQPSATDEWADVKLISEKDGKITELNPEPIVITIQDGFYLGYINKQYGNGLVTWNFQWDAAHYEPHKYEIKIYQWDSKKTSFVFNKKFITKRKHETGCDALKHYDLPCKNFRDEIIKIEVDYSILGAESLLPESE